MYRTVGLKKKSKGEKDYTKVIFRALWIVIKEKANKLGVLKSKS